MLGDENEYKIDFRTRNIEVRKVREGSAMHSEFRVNIINLDETIEEGVWFRTGTIPNYGEVFDKKPSFMYRVFAAMGMVDKST